ncbi:phage tail tape measure protein [Rhizobium ruizarguesonis]|uniref:phage tail tape measure protein n=1 Tax=Rhizobium ruizarguesonis TaxID=2081791 RepID=UPI0010307146|nr:phage tail tape measure protein [Rhizobium ruizarguesonis]TBB53790.1 phage tail tape measure protein [Rhizobium ruizarguesonis]
MAGGTLTSTLIVRLLDQVTKPARSAGSALLGLNRAANAASGTFGARLGAAIQKNNAALADARGGLVDAVAGFYALKTAIGAPVREAMAFESAMADVKKVVDFPTPKAFQDFQAALVDLSKRVPMSVNGLAQIAAAAGQAGIAGDDLIKFTEAAAKVGVAFDISADQAGDALAKLMTGLGLTIDQAVLLTDSRNHLSNAQASSAAEILDVVRRVGAQSKQFGFNATQVAAFASAMISAGAESDVAATSFRNMGLALTKGASATKAQRGAFKELGLDAKKVAKNMQKDAVGTTLDVLEKISKLPKEMQASVSSDLFGNEARALGPLLTNIKLLRDSRGLVDDQSKYAGSSFKEFEVRSKTFANAVQVFNNRLTALKIVIGAALIPALNDLMARISPLVDQITTFAQANPELTRSILAAAAAVVAFKVAATSLRYVGLIGRGGLLSAVALGFNTIGRAAIGATTAVREAVGLQRALGAMSGMKMTGLQTVATALRAMVLAVPGVSAIAGALSAVGAALATITAPVWLAIGAAVAVVAAAGALLWKYWDRISSVVGGVAKRIGEELQPAFDRLKPALDLIRPVISGIGDAFSYAGEKLSQFAGWIGSFFSKEVLSDQQKAGFEKAGYDVADMMINAIKSAFNGLLDWFKGLPARIVEAIGTIDLTSMIKVPSIRSLFGSDDAAAVPSAPSNDNAPTSGHRAKGGKVWPGGSFVVGDGGEPEIFQPKTAGTITPASQAGGMKVTFGNIIVNGTGDPVQTARLVAKEIEDRISSLLRGSHCDSGAYA